MGVSGNWSRTEARICCRGGAACCFRTSWLVPGSRAFSRFQPDIDQSWRNGQISWEVAFAESERRLASLAAAELGRISYRRDRPSTEDLVQELYQRLASMEAADRFDSSRSSPEAFLRGILRMLLKEQLCRRPRPCLVFGVPLDCIPEDGDELDGLVRREMIEELHSWLDQLSPGEIRALVRKFGPLFDWSPPVGRARRLKNPNAFPEAVATLQRLGAHRIGQ